VTEATIVFAPAPGGQPLLAEACETAERRLRQRGHAVTMLDLGEFDPVLSPSELSSYYSDRPLLADETIAAAEAVGRSNTLVFIYPTVLLTLPPTVKGWLDRVLVPGVAFRMTSSGRIRRGLRHIDRVVGISTYDTTWWLARRRGDSGRRIVARNLRACTRLTTRTRWVAAYTGADGSAPPPGPFLRRVAHAVAP
jgi:NAD(P)H dehydrogenase (quinone)